MLRLGPALALATTALLLGGGVALAVALVGTVGDDVLRGTAQPDSLVGKAGDDRLYGFGGGDSIVGGPGSDRSRDGDGDDTITGGEGDDFLFGGAGADVRSGGEGDDLIAESFELDEADVDRLHGGGGDDFLESVNFPASRDVLRCGAGTDEVQADPKDVVGEDCERVQIID